MKEVAAGAALLALTSLVIGFIYGLARAAWRNWHRRHDPWELAEHSDGELVSLYAERPGEKLLLGAVAFAAADFDCRLYELRAQGREKVCALNNKEA